MLVLSRKTAESIHLKTETGETVAVLKLLSVRGRQARIGIEAPPNLKIVRGELPPGAKQSGGRLDP